MSNLYYFNPTCELAVANGSFSYQPPLLLQQMESDLATLPMFFCNSHDIVLANNKPSNEFLGSLMPVGLEVPSFMNLEEAESLPNNLLQAIYPWGWSPAAHFKLKTVKEKCDKTFIEQPNSSWLDDHQKLYERATSLNFLKEFIEKNGESIFMNINQTGRIVNSISEIEHLLTANRPVVIKAPMSSSGRGVQIIRKSMLNTTNKQWLSGILKQQNYLVLEPFINKLSDLSFQFNIISEHEVEFLGVSFFETNSNGQYQCTLLNPDLKFLFPGRVTEVNELLAITADRLSSSLKQSVYAKFHRGFMGVDAMIYLDNSLLKIQPCVEINCRMNMGILALHIQEKIHPEAKGKFELTYCKDGIQALYTMKNNEKPEYLDGKLYSGLLPLTETTEKSKFSAYISLGTAR